MASLMNSSRWQLAPVDEKATQKLAETFGLSVLAARVLVSRGIDTVERARTFLQPSMARDWRDPRELPDIEQGLRRIAQAVEAGEQIAVFGDFDVDGLSATCLITQALEKVGAKVKPYIPSRFGEGYGLSRPALMRVIADCNPALIVTVDTGIAAREEVAWLCEQGIDVVVTDHHEPGDLVPQGVPVIDPKRDPKNQSHDLAGAAVALKLVQLIGEYFGKPDLHLKFIDIACLGTISDIMPLNPENRALVYEGIERLRKGKRPGIVALSEVVGLDIAEVVSDQLGFTLIPRLNAAGRLSDPELALRVLMATNHQEAYQLALELESINTMRRDIEADFAEQAIARIEATQEPDDRVIVAGSESWHEGVKGIVAARIARKYQLPTILFSISDGVAHGSGRTVGSIDLFRALEPCKDLLLQYGGHKAAVGVTCEAANLGALRERLQDILSDLDHDEFVEKGVVDATIELDEIDIEAIASLIDLRPFGPGNAVPRFGIRGVTMAHRSSVGQSQDHFRFAATDGKNSIFGIMFNAPHIEELLEHEGVVDLVVEVENDTWQGVTRPKLLVRDILRHDENKPMQTSPLLDHLFALSDSCISRDEYASIADADSFNTKLAGVTFDGRQEVLASLKPGQLLSVVREYENKFDPNAIKIFTTEDTPREVGFLNRRLAHALAPVIDSGVEYSAEVTSVTGGVDKQQYGLNVVVRKITCPLMRLEKDAVAMADRHTEAVKLKQRLSALDFDELTTEVKTAFIGEGATFLPAQQEALENLAENRNTLCVMATGRGKSLIFQTHAARLALAEHKASILVYPLRALVSDQAFHIGQAFEQLGLQVRVLCGETSLGGRAHVFEELADKTVDVILTTPEFLSIHADKFAASKRVGFVVIDEAHHAGLAKVGQGHRSAYTEMPRVLQQLGNPTVLAVTATASSPIARGIQELLNIDDLVLDASIRENLLLDDGRSTRSRDARVTSIVARGEKTIVYVNSREQSIALARILRKHIWELGNSIAFYNAGLDRDTRLKVEEAFRRGEITCVIATSAFGEGINLPDVRHVILYHMPFGDVEFNQMSGRAGRDGKDGWVHVLFGPADARINERIIASSAPDRDDLMAIYKTLDLLAREAAQDEDASDAMAGGLVAVEHAPFSMTNAALAEAVVSRYPQHRSIDERSVSSAISIFRELNFLETRGQGISRQIVMTEKPVHRDLEDSIRYLEGMRSREAFAAFRDWALQSSARELLERFNRPIMPLSKTIDE